MDAMMDLDELSRQVESMHRQFLRLSPADGIELPEPDTRMLWVETSENLGVTLEELRVVEEELRRQNAELEKSRRATETEKLRYRELFDLAPDGYVTTDLYGMIKEANRAAGELLGVSPVHLAGKPLANYVAMSQRLAFRGGINRLQRVGRREDWRVRIQPRRGAPFDARITASVVHDWDGTPIGYRWLIREESPAVGRVTVGLPESAVAEERRGIEDEAEGLRALLRGIDLIVWEADARTGRCWYISPRAEQVLGYPAESWTDEPGFWGEIIHAEDRALAASRRARCLREGKGGELEYRVVAADGRVVWFRESIGVEFDEDGRPRVMRGCLWDISRRKKVERRIYTDRRKLAEHLSDVWHLYLLGGQLLATLELGPVLEEILSAVAAIQGAELAALRLLDRDRGELETVVSLGLPPEYLERFGRIPVGEQACGRAVARGEPIVVVEDVEAESGDAAGWAEPSRLGGFRACYSVPLVTRRGEVIGTIATFFREPHRPSPRQVQLVQHYVLQAADALDNARAHKEVHDADRRKEEFLATLAHELRNPLAAIQTSAHLLHAEVADAELLDEAREVIIRQVRHMSRLAEDLLDVTRVSRGTMRLRTEPVDLAEAVARAVEDVRPLVDARRHELVVAMPEGKLILDADPTRLEQVLANLLTNAAKYTDPGGRIELAAEREADEVVIRVRDSGIGLAPEALVGLFQLFSQVDVGQDRSRGGLGIGLALVKSLVELHGGSVWASSDGPGHGSEFTARLPLAR
jgi:PAS domain S-box-containing protein